MSGKRGWDLEQLCRSFLDFRIFVSQGCPQVLSQVGEGEAVGVDLAKAAGDSRVDASLGILVLLQHHPHKTLCGRLQHTKFVSASMRIPKLLSAAAPGRLPAHIKKIMDQD
jgi:hypothetical protein